MDSTKNLNPFKFETKCDIIIPSLDQVKYTNTNIKKI